MCLAVVSSLLRRCLPSSGVCRPRFHCPHHRALTLPVRMPPASYASPEAYRAMPSYLQRTSEPAASPGRPRMKRGITTWRSRHVSETGYRFGIPSEQSKVRRPMSLFLSLRAPAQVDSGEPTEPVTSRTSYRLGQFTHCAESTAQRSRPESSTLRRVHGAAFTSGKLNTAQS